MMSEERVLEALTDFATAIEAAAVQLKQEIAALYGVGLNEEPFLGLAWERSEGDRLGEFEFTTRKANNNSDAFNHCYNTLKANDATIKNHFDEKGWQHYYWLYPDRPDTIFRKGRTGKELEPKPAVDVIEAVKAKFPEDLSVLLTFEQERDYAIIKPRQYLGSENFAKIAAIVRDVGGEYISAGKDSHFKVPRSK